MYSGAALRLQSRIKGCRLESKVVDLTSANSLLYLVVYKTTFCWIELSRLSPHTKQGTRESFRRYVPRELSGTERTLD